MDRRFDIALQGPGLGGEALPGRVLRDVLQVFVEGTTKAVRFAFEGRSSAPGSKPNWLQPAARFDVLQQPGHLLLTAPALENVMPLSFMQADFFADRSVDFSRSAIDLFDDGLQDALAGKADSDRFDDGLVAVYANLSRIFEQGVERLEIVNGHAFAVQRDGLERVQELKRTTPPPQAVRIAGKLDAIRHHDRMFTLVLDSGLALRGVADEVEELRALFGKHAMVEGQAIFRPAGTVLRVDARRLLPATAAEATFWANVPHPLQQAGDARGLRRPQGPRSGINAILGQWPGDESDEVIRAALEDLS